MLIRKARPEEADSLTALALRSKRAWGYSEDFMQRIMPDMIVHSEFLSAEHGMIAEEAGVILGYAIVRVAGNEAFLRDLFVEPSRFREGAGRALFKAALRHAKRRGARTMTLEGDPNAIGFYKRMGMRQIGSEPSIAGGGRMLPIMAMNVS